ncbi:hypothetical protein [Streptomyces regalis]|uniref:hypothetical protein n=1 Tax=Streptomyces regalis TaxID=68262 RepID=UPI000AB58082|nr:hypothetical protein [Streptomyces regalis]
MTKNRQPPQQPYLELRVGDFHLTLQRRPVRVLTVLTLLLCLSGVWTLGGGTFPML